MKAERIALHTPFIRLDALLKYCGAADTGGYAKEFIRRGEVLVEGEVCLQRGRKIRPGMLVEIGGRRYEVSSQ